MGSNFRSRAIYLLHPDERSAPQIIENAAEVRCIRRGHEPDLSIKQFDAAVVIIGAPMDHEAHVALDRMATMMLPVLGFGTGPNERLIADVSVTISLGDLRSMISLLGSPATLCSLPPGHGANGLGTWLKHSADNFAQMMEHLLALRMPDYRDRAERVVQACLWIGSHLGMGGEELNTLQLAARMREIGKLGLPDRILFATREQRTQDEQSMYDRYPMLGARVLQQFPLFLGAAKIVEHHLENFDGSGAMNLASHQIPLGSRILRVASAFQMISDTGAKGREEVIRILGRGRGSLYDPMLVGLVDNYATLATSPLNSGLSTRRVRLSDLVEGMILAEDIWSRTGVKIVGAGTRLNEHIIRILMTLPLNMAIESVEVQREVA
jgi:HD-GYP domain-containing protein (c-di-GMP phosphodiesterase class II)